MLWFYLSESQRILYQQDTKNTLPYIKLFKPHGRTQRARMKQKEKSLLIVTAKHLFSFHTDLLTRRERLNRKGASLRSSHICHNTEMDSKVMRRVKINKIISYQYLCALNKRRIKKKKFCLDWVDALAPQMHVDRCSNAFTYKTAFEDWELPTSFAI